MNAHFHRLTLIAFALMFLSQGLAQQGPPPGPPPNRGPSQQREGGAFPPGDEHSRMRRGIGPPPGPEGQAGAVSTMRGGLQLGPPGRWWRDSSFAAALHLQPDQQSRMDKVFAENKETLFARYDDLRHREQELESLTRGVPISEPSVFVGIDRLAMARAALEKANAHMQLQMRMQLASDQLMMLDEHRPSPPLR